MKIHHVGYLVKKIDKALEAFKSLGYSVKSDIVLDDYRKVKICFLEKDGYVIELISPSSDESVVSNLYKRLGNTPYHICYETDNMEREIERLNKLHFKICSDRYEAVAIDGKDVCFLVHPYMGMIELLEV